MLLRFMRAQLEPGAWDEFRSIFLSLDAAELKGLGLHARWLLRDVDDPDTVFIVALWESEQAVERFSAHGALTALHMRTFGHVLESHLCEIRSEWRASAAL
jgi:heme-degrading monooxygenase HmoA